MNAVGGSVLALGSSAWTAAVGHQFALECEAFGQARAELRECPRW